MDIFVESEVIRLGNLINSRLHGGSDDELEPDSLYDSLISLLASYIPDPWGIYQTSDKDLLIAALQEHDIEPDGATFILQTQLLQWYEQFIMQIDAEIDCGGDFYTATSSWVDLLPVLYGLPDEFSDLVYLPDKVDALKRAAEVGEKSAEILRDYQNEEAFRDIYQNYYDYREGAAVVEDVSVMRNYLEVWPSSIFVKIELSDEEYEDLFQALECRYLCEKKQEAIQKLRNNERKIVAAKIQEFSSDLRKIERTFDRLLEEKR
ncbi:hypothetical protein [Methanospirillum hungatei]|uniref:hypothetical protein n=1 Tax=Methanospirillum hungatei TaxID=2203 RepID=UPI0026EF69FA|nr:hypothetical protein [Methanospirillum hungatei]MCA1917148.1 hypothetical protein [Methanospirillum hungatei]